MCATPQFFDQIPGIKQFAEIVDVDHYQPLPDDWLVIATDIRGSTEAIAAGRYKAVNMAGACVIAAICNEFPEMDTPFVFGGDGATIVMPDVGKERVLGILKYCRQAVKTAYKLDLAAGCEKMKVLRQQGKEIRVGKYLMSEHVNQAIFWGEGVDYIEEIIKKPGNNLSEIKSVEADFSGLECRWNEIPSHKEEVLSVIIKSTLDDESGQSSFYRQCLEKIESIYGDESDYRPLSTDRMTLAGHPLRLKEEMNIRAYPGKAFKRVSYLLKLCFLQFAGTYLMGKNISTKENNWGEYKTDFVKNADFRKFSDGLKLVLSGTRDQRQKLREFLTLQFQEGRAVFGTHSSPASLTTCYITNYSKHHVHFIDGTDGGYASASVELKQQVKQLKQAKQKGKNFLHEN